MAWSLGVAVVIHVAAFAFWPDTPVEPLGELQETAVSGVEEEGVFVEVSAEFIGPEIVASGGRITSERVTRTLEARRLTRVRIECREALGPGRRYEGEIRLLVNDEGRVDQKELARGSGDPCGDETLLALAGDLWYRWLPSGVHPSPVVVIQPVSVTGVVSGDSRADS